MTEDGQWKRTNERRHKPPVPRYTWTRFAKETEHTERKGSSAETFRGMVTLGPAEVVGLNKETVAGGRSNSKSLRSNRKQAWGALVVTAAMSQPELEYQQL